MFTGIVHTVGKVTSREARGGSMEFCIEALDFAGSTRPGDSVAIDGVCLTVTTSSDTGFSVDAVDVTMARTTLGGWKVGRPVNLERALVAGQPLGGHLVQGHVDGVGIVTEMVREREQSRLGVQIPESVAAVTVPRGSLAIDGVSLTVAGVSEDVAQFAIIPYTWSHTTLCSFELGSRVNVEADVIGKYVRRLVEPYRASAVAARDETHG